MAPTRSTKIRVIKPEDIIWEEAFRGPQESEPPGREFTAAHSVDDKFSFGLWRRDQQSRRFERSYHEIAYNIEGQVEVTDDDGEVLIAGPGDILITPQGRDARGEFDRGKTIASKRCRGLNSTAGRRPACAVAMDND